jgi:hypothetical protein
MMNANTLLQYKQNLAAALRQFATICGWALILSLSLLLILAARPALAQDQMVVIRETPKVFEKITFHKPDHAEDTVATTAFNEKGVLRQENAEELILTVLSRVDPSAQIEDDACYIIHIYRYLDDETSVDKQNWYVYHKPWADASKHSLFAHLDDLQVAKHFKEHRIYGNSKIALLYLHLNVPAASKQDIEVAATKQLKKAGAPHADQVEPALISRQIFDQVPTVQLKDDTPVGIQTSNKKDYVVVPVKLKGHINGLAGMCDYLKDDKDEDITVCNYLVDERFLPITYKVAVTKKVPDPQQSAKAIAGLVLGAQGSGQVTLVIPLKSYVLGTLRMMELTPRPANIVVTGSVGGGEKARELAKETYDNEKKYHYNFSFAFPFKSYDSVTLDLSNQLITPKKLTKQNVYAMINLSPWAIDTKKPQLQLFPTFIYGMPITGKPLHQQLVGVAFGFNFLQPFVGIHFDRNQTQTNGQVQTRWVRKLSYGLNIPVTTATTLLNKK